MRRLLPFTALFLAVLFVASCSQDPPTAPESSNVQDITSLADEQITAEIFSMTGWEVDQPESLPELNPDKIFSWIVGYQRTELVGQIVHYRWDIRMSFGENDVITLHRVVKERRHQRPIRTRLNIFLQHGDAKDFQGMFLPGTLSATTPVDFGAAVYWAERNVDVWGIDQAWNNVEAETSDFGFMADWGMDKQYRDLGRAVTIARLTRLISGNGFGKMNLLGYSSGSSTGYALLNAETQLPPFLRQVGSWIPVDYSPVSDDQEWNDIQNCDYVAEYEAMLANGDYGYAPGFDFLGILARDEPNEPSPVFEGMTNLEAGMFLGAGPIFGYANIHYLAGLWEDEMPVGFAHCTVEQWVDFMVAGSPWQPTRQIRDYAVWGCMEEDVPWDDHFADIQLPVLNLSAAGGIGPTTHYALGLLGSSDITDYSIQLLSDEEALFDFGHIDLFIADVAPGLVWQPILDWIGDRTPGHGHHGQGHCD